MKKQWFKLPALVLAIGMLSSAIIVLAKGNSNGEETAPISTVQKGKWIDATNKWGKACKAYVIDDCDREKYIERSVLVNMTLLRKTAAEKAMTGAINRVIRALTGLKGQYTKAESEKPFAIPRVTFAPDYTDPEVKRVLLSQGMSSIGSLFGVQSIPASSTPALEMSSGLSSGNSMFDPEEFADNPAFASDTVVGEEDGQPERNWFDQNPEEEQTPPSQQTTPQQEASGYACDGCGAEISEKVYSYSLDKFGRPLCIKCQRGGH